MGNDACKRRGGPKVSSSDRYQTWIWVHIRKILKYRNYFLNMKSWNNTGMLRLTKSHVSGFSFPILFPGRSYPLRAKCTTAEVCWSPVAETYATAWMRIAWAASTPVPIAAPASVASSVAATGSGCTSRWKWRGARSSGTSLQAKEGGKNIAVVLRFYLFSILK